MEIKLAKISASTEADQALDRILEKVNTGFTGGRVTKVDLTSWLILYFESQSFEDCVEKIRRDHFDHVAYLESVVKEMKQARKSGLAMPDISALLAPVTSQIKSISAQKKPRSDKSEPQII